ncbi:hypothetical protein LissoIVSPER_00053, partial [Lissonota sp. PSUC_FEM 10030012]|nr:hypothetical protein [Lissonota sp. PSUC_FEM 10030012]
VYISSSLSSPAVTYIHLWLRRLYIRSRQFQRRNVNPSTSVNRLFGTYTYRLEEREVDRQWERVMRVDGKLRVGTLNA